MANDLVPYKQALMEYKLLSQVECLYILLYLVKHRMGGYMQINEGYKKLINDTSDHTPIKDRHVKEVISQGWVKVNKLGILSLDRNVDNISDLLVRIDWFEGSVPRMYNYENNSEFYITNDWQKVYTVRNYRGDSKGKFKTLRPAIDLKNELNTKSTASKLKDLSDPIADILSESEIVIDDFGNKINRLGEQDAAKARRRLKSKKLAEKKRKDKEKAKAKEKERKRKAKEKEKAKQKKSALGYLKNKKNKVGLSLINLENNNSISKT